MAFVIRETESPPRLVEVTEEHGFLYDRKLTDNFIVRHTILEMLTNARDHLPTGINFKIGELYRTLEKQKRMWHEV
jgi:hypothetical protein